MINHQASLQLGRLAREAGVTRFLFASSCSMYGAAGNDDVLTEEAPLKPLTAYAISKVRAEETLSQLADSSFSLVFMRNATAYGLAPRLRADVEKIKETRPDYLLILPWNLKDEIMAQMAEIHTWGGQFVIPIPALEVRA